MDKSGSQFPDLRRVIDTCPIIDNHAHNLLRVEKLSAYDLLSATTEASGDALKDTPQSLAHRRALRQYRELYGCSNDAQWPELMQKRAELLRQDPDALTRFCLQGTHTILMDDGINDEKTVHFYRWHDQFTTGRTRRIVRIETVAADIMKVLCEEGRVPLANLQDIDHATVWVVFLQAFETAIADEVKSGHVAGFKSVCCYRSGLDVKLDKEVNITVTGQHAFREYLYDCVKGNYRISRKGLIDCLVISTCKLLAANFEQSGVRKPFQFHTGLGDNDISLVKSNPAYLQPLIAAFPTVSFVLLHSSYPYTREAGYLATVYRNTYLDLGEVFPMVNREGQVAIIKQSMELTPFNKLLWSTDGHHFPETYWLANKQFREALYVCLSDLIKNRDLTEDECKKAAVDILFNNSNVAYQLNLGLQIPSPSTIDPSTIDPSTIAPVAIAERSKSTPKTAYDLRHWRHFVRNTWARNLSFVIVQWLDYLGTLRCRVLPLRSFHRMISANEHLGISYGNVNTLQDDTVTSAVNPVGNIKVSPDLLTLREVHRKDMSETAIVMSSFLSDTGDPHPGCPRSTLQRLSTQLETAHNITILAGFELEVTFLYKPKDKDEWQPLTSSHAWGTLTDEQLLTSYPLLTRIALELEDSGINLLHFHAESGKGQYEFVLPPLPLVEAVDTLVQTRYFVQSKAARAGLRATFHCKPFSHGSGAHAHISLNSAEPLEKKEQAFVAGILSTLSAICAFALPQKESYVRVGDDLWSGGKWIAYGTQNREVPLRKIKDGRYEIRCLDGFANAYLAMSAVVGAGIWGIEHDTECKWMDCDRNPSTLTKEEREGYGIVDPLPGSIEEALEALEKSEVLRTMLGDAITRDYAVMKRAEQEKLGKITDDERREWLIARY